MTEPEILPLGHDGLVIRFGVQAREAEMTAAQACHARVAGACVPGVSEVVPALVSVLVRFDPGAVSRAAVRERLREIVRGVDWAAAGMPPPTRRWHVPVCFGGEAGPLLEEAAALAGVDGAAAVRDLTGADLRVLAIGFAPGMPYLGLLPERWDIPRATELTPRVPAGAVVVAVRQVVLFPAPTPTGWRQVGLARFRPFLPEAAEPIPLRPGDAVRLEPVSRAEFDGLPDDGIGGARCRVLA